MDAGLQALFWFLLKKRTRNSRLTARATLQRSASERIYRIRRKTRLTVLLLTALVSHFTVERSLWQIPRTSAWFDLAYSTYSDDQWYASFRVSKNTFQFLLLTRMWSTLNNWRRAPRARKNVTELYREKGERLHVEKETKMWVRNRFLSVPFRKGSKPPIDLFRNGTDKTGTGQVPFTRQILSEPFVFLSEPFQFFRSCKRAFQKK